MPTAAPVALAHGRAAKIAASLSLMAILAHPATAQRLPFTPPDSQVSYTVYILGALPLHGYFKQFQGTVALDPHLATACHVDVTITVASLTMDDPDRQRQALGPDLLDADHFPAMHFVGRCQHQGVAGLLTMHGVTHPLALLLRQQSGMIIGSGSIRRQDYGITGLPHLVGSRVRIKLSMPAQAGIRLASP